MTSELCEHVEPSIAGPDPIWVDGANLVDRKMADRVGGGIDALPAWCADLVFRRTLHSEHGSWIIVNPYCAQVIALATQLYARNRTNVF